MEFTYEISGFEIGIVSIFIIAYFIFILKNVKIAKSLNKNYPLTTILKFLLRFSALTLLIISLLAPTFGTKKANILAVAKDIFIAVDLSESMNAQDIQPSRLEKVKFELKKIINEFPSDRIGLIIFSNEAFVQCPLTYDKSAIALFIETLSSNLVPNAGTDFFEPLQLAYNKFLIEDEDAKKSSKIILLISDGEDFSDKTTSILEDLTDQNIKIFTLGVGTKKGIKIPTKRGYKKDKEGNEVVSKLNSKDLKKIAYDTEGKYYEINDELTQTEKLINDINKIKGEIRETKLLDVNNNKYFYFTFAALTIIIIDFLFQTKTFKL